MAPSEPTRVSGLGLTIPPGTRLNGIFEIERQIGAGGMGMVFAAHNVETGDKVAIKIVRAEMAGNEQVLALFRKEAAVLHRLLHDAIVRYYLFTSDPDIGRPYLATEFVDGTSLADMGRLPRDEVLALAERLAGGLQAAHELSVFHRDISPDNVILPARDVRRAKIIDFGIARSAALGGGTVIGDSIAGKFDYMSPEQLGLYGGQVDARSDIYSLGIVLAEAVLGDSLRMGGTQLDVVEKRRKVPDLAAVEPKLRGLLAAMLQPRPEDRIASMAAVAEEARRLRAGPVATARRGRPLWPVAAGIAGVLVLGGAAAWLLMPGPAPDAPPAAPPTLVRQSDPTPAPPALTATAGATTAEAGRAAPPPESAGSDAGTAAGAAAESASSDAGPTAGSAPAAMETAAGGGVPASDAGLPDAAAAWDAGQPAEGAGAAPDAGGTAEAGSATPSASGAAGEATADAASAPEAAPPDTAAADENGAAGQTGATAAAPGASEAPARPEPETAVARADAAVAAGIGATGDARVEVDNAAEGVAPEPPASGEAAPAAAGDESAAAPQADEPEEDARQETEGSEETQEARLAPQDTPVTGADGAPAADLAGRIRQFLAGAQLGPCSFATLDAVGADSAEIVAYGNSVPPFQRLDETFRETFQFGADINLRPVTDGQCPAVELARAVDPPGGTRLRVAVDRDAVTPGGLLSGTVSGIGERKLHLYLVGGDGHLYGLADLMERRQDVATFRASMASSQEGARNYVLVAVAAKSLPNMPSRTDGNTAADLDTLRAYLADDPGAEAALGYFKYGGS